MIRESKATESMRSLLAERVGFSLAKIRKLFRITPNTVVSRFPSGFEWLSPRTESYRFVLLCINEKTRKVSQTCHRRSRFHRQIAQPELTIDRFHQGRIPLLQGRHKIIRCSHISPRNKLPLSLS